MPRSCPVNGRLNPAQDNASCGSSGLVAAPEPPACPSRPCPIRLPPGRGLPAQRAHVERPRETGWLRRGHQPSRCGVSGLSGTEVLGLGRLIGVVAGGGMAAGGGGCEAVAGGGFAGNAAAAGE